MFVFCFLLWTLMLYWIHRVGHIIPVINAVHLHHHRYILTHTTKWHWSNLLLFNDDLTSTIDLWITEVIPTLVFSLVTGQYWISIFYYIWAAFIQESIEHNPKVNIPLLTSGRWHLIHHRSDSNYGLFFPLWDIIFGTYKNVHK
jgi:sterol desaturase/sphingolipid hydroxylase (fatty acid hydroxylase superfamily)